MIEDIFKTIAKRYRIIEGRKWHEVSNRDFLTSLNSLERKNIDAFYQRLLDEGYFEKIDGELLLTKKGEGFVYGDNNDPYYTILKKLFELGACEGFCWQFAAYNSFRSSLNPVEEKLSVISIEKMVNEGLLRKNDFDEMLVLTKKGEDKIIQLFGL